MPGTVLGMGGEWWIIKKWLFPEGAHSLAGKQSLNTSLQCSVMAVPGTRSTPYLLNKWLTILMGKEQGTIGARGLLWPRHWRRPAWDKNTTLLGPPPSPSLPLRGWPPTHSPFTEEMAAISQRTSSNLQTQHLSFYLLFPKTSCFTCHLNPSFHAFPGIVCHCYNPFFSST